ncbi:hypothetical protein BURMUCGD2M_5151 [Burkholderia multivorans CGD2M]|uniref:Uncharacterized protein n=1 Tax=Burkholderia multivorans CGD2 TaxID=513052 RepID=B9BJA2_9BURK|nr:hypothetical protein BURMUCGD2_5158 [Burkholderia multivorans CGD2]EEE15708.1 hypothetical protein BURMUCGD2M_5151 [Burkholderia multivorans CGD2M]
MDDRRAVDKKPRDNRYSVMRKRLPIIEESIFDRLSMSH